MKAVICERYGGPEVLKLVDRPKPGPKDNELLIRIHATTVNSGDARIRALRVPRGLALPMRLSMGFSGPRQPVLGFELAGEVEAVGSQVTHFRPGERVIGSSGFTLGCYAEFKCLPADAALAHIPQNLSFAEAVSLCFGGTTAASFFSRAGLQSGETLLINGASGAVGTAGVQIAKHLGAEVTGVCSTENLELVSSLGADHLIDYTKNDFTRNGVTYDAIMDNVGNAPFARVRGSLKPKGRFLMVYGSLPQMIEGALRKRVIGGVADPSERVFGEPAFSYLMRLAEVGALKPVIDRTYPLEEIAAAHAYVDTGHKKGSVVIAVSHDA
jgi:NADPH:quinone reductase-like Zn-dependent oxidoreductase